MKAYMIFHRGDNQWVYTKTRVLKHVRGLPLVSMTQAVTAQEFLFSGEKKARKAVERMNNG